MAPRRAAVKRNAQVAPKEKEPLKKAKRQPEVSGKPDSRRISGCGVVLSFGQGDVGQLGLGEEVMEKLRPTQIHECQNIVAIAAGGMHSVCLEESGKVITFGCNDEGALGRSTTEEGAEAIPGYVDLPGKVVQITAGDSHTAVLLDDGRVFAWGSFRDSHGTMGLTIKGNQRLPVEMLPEVKTVKIASGADHLVMLDDTGNLYTCGCGEQGQLGRISMRTADRHSRRGVEPLLAPGLVTIKASKKLRFDDVWAGSYCTFVREHPTGDIYAFGLNNYHQMGLKDPTTYFHPSRSKTFAGKSWRHLSTGQHHTIALDQVGKVFVMGRNEYGRLGLGTDCNDAKELTPVETLADMRCIDVAAGAAQSFAVTDSGQLYSWGMGTNGQLGTGKEEDAHEPVAIKAKQLENKTVVRVSGGGQHTLILATGPQVKDKSAGC